MPPMVTVVDLHKRFCGASITSNGRSAGTYTWTATWSASDRGTAGTLR
jgi:hypothetical protein